MFNNVYSLSTRVKASSNAYWRKQAEATLPAGPLVDFRFMGVTIWGQERPVLRGLDHCSTLFSGRECWPEMKAKAQAFVFSAKHVKMLQIVSLSVFCRDLSVFLCSHKPAIPAELGHWKKDGQSQQLLSPLQHEECVLCQPEQLEAPLHLLKSERQLWLDIFLNFLLSAWKNQNMHFDLFQAPMINSGWRLKFFSGTINIL